MKYLRIIVPVFVLALILSSCHKDPPKTYDDTDMTITYYNTEFNFDAYSTFLMPDSVLLKTNYLTDSEVANIYKSGGSSDQILELLRSSFIGIGYAEVDNVEAADFIAVPTLMLMQSDETIIYNPGWWWGYPGYGWGCCYYKSTNYYYYPVYPWYPVGVPVTVSTYNGTMAYEMLDAASYLAVVEWNENNPDPGPEDESPVYEINWQATVEGYTTDDGDYDKERVVNGTNEAFAQSPYLHK